MQNTRIPVAIPATHVVVPFWACRGPGIAEFSSFNGDEWRCHCSGIEVDADEGLGVGSPDGGDRRLLSGLLHLQVLVAFEDQLVKSRAAFLQVAVAEEFWSTDGPILEADRRSAEPC